jgi:hypothetical protein
MNNLGNALINLNRLDDAYSIIKECLEIRKLILPKFHPDIGDSLNNLASVLTSLNKLV